jgi:hypothetical protein
MHWGIFATAKTGRPFQARYIRSVLRTGGYCRHLPGRLADHRRCALVTKSGGLPAGRATIAGLVTGCGRIRASAGWVVAV